MAKKATKTRKQAETKTPETASVVQQRFRERYASRGGSCGDELAALLAERTRDPETGNVEMAKLKAVAEANTLWEARYSQLNVGLQDECPATACEN